MPDTVAPGHVLGGRYRLNHELARGGMATVWVAEDPLLSRRVAIKILHPELAVNAALRTRFRNEAVAAAKLSHPAIVATYDTGDDDGVAYIVMQLVEGPTLRRMLDARGKLPVSEAVDIACQVAEALEHAHSHGLVHRDIKPANVLIPPDGQIKVTDFGIAKATGDEDLTQHRRGDRHRALPRARAGQRPTVDGRADVYALGLILYEMLTATLPFSGDSEIATAMARLTAPPKPVRELRPEVPPMVDSIVNRSLALDPDHRFPSARAFEDALDPARDATPPPGDARSRRGGAGGSHRRLRPDRHRHAGCRASRRRRACVRDRRWGRMAGAALVAALVVLAVFFVGACRDRRRRRRRRGGGAGGGAASDQVAIVGATDFDPDGDGGESGASRRPGPRREQRDGLVDRALQQPRLRRPQARGRARARARRRAGASAAWRSPPTTKTGTARSTSPTSAAPSSRTGARPVDQGEGLGGLAAFDLPDGTRGRFVLVWITRLPADGKLGAGRGHGCQLIHPTRSSPPPPPPVTAARSNNSSTATPIASTRCAGA